MKIYVARFFSLAFPRILIFYFLPLITLCALKFEISYDISIFKAHSKTFKSLPISVKFKGSLLTAWHFKNLTIIKQSNISCQLLEEILFHSTKSLESLSICDYAKKQKMFSCILYSTVDSVTKVFSSSSWGLSGQVVLVVLL